MWDFHEFLQYLLARDQCQCLLVVQISATLNLEKSEKKSGSASIPCGMKLGNDVKFPT